MSQFPQIQIEGPQAVRQPKASLYQESQTYLPKTEITVTQGIDLGAIGESFGRLGQTVVEGFNQLEVTRKANALEALRNKTKKLVDDWASVNDFDGVDLTFYEYKQAAKDILGFDPDADENQAMLGSYGKLAADVRSFNADVDASVAKAKRGWADTIAMDNYDTYTSTEEADFQKADDKFSSLDGRLQRLQKMYEGVVGKPISEQLPKTGYSVDNRKLYLQMQRDYAKLLEERNKLSSGKPDIQLVGEQVINQLKLSKTLFDSAKAKKEEAAKIRSQDTISAEEEMAAQYYDSQALTFATQASQIRSLASASLIDVAKKEYLETFVGPVEEDVDSIVPEYMRNPESIDAYSFLMTAGLSNETGTALSMAFQAEEEARSTFMSQGLKVSGALFKTQLDNVKGTIDVSVSEVETALKTTDVQIKEALDSGNIPLANNLKAKKVALIEELQRKIRDRHIIPSLPRSLRMKSPAMATFISGQNQSGKLQSTYTDKLNLEFILKDPTQGFGISFDSDSRNILAAAVGNDKAITIPVYDHSIKEINRLKRLYADNPSEGGSAASKAKEMGDDYLRWATGRYQLGPEVTSERMHTLALFGASKRLSSGSGLPTTLGSLPSLDEAVEIIRSNQNNPEFLGNQVPFSINQFMLTPWFQELLEKADAQPTVEAARQYMNDTINMFVTGPEKGSKFADFVPDTGSPGVPINSSSVDHVISLIENNQKNTDVTAMAFMILPKQTRQFIIDKVNQRNSNSNNPEVSVPAMHTITWLETMHREYSGQQSALNFIQGFNKRGITPIIAKDSDDKFKLIMTYRSPQAAEELKKRRKGATETEEETARLDFVEQYHKKWLPKILEGIQIPGWTPELANTRDGPRRFDSLFLNDILLNMHIAATDQNLGYNFDKPEVISETIDRLNEKFRIQGWRFDTNDGFKRHLGERTELPNGLKAVDIPGRTIQGVTGLNIPTEDRLRFTLFSGRFEKPTATDETSYKLLLGQVGEAFSSSPEARKLVEEDPFTGLVHYGIVTNGYVSKTMLEQLGTSGSGVVRQLTSAATSGMPRDNLGVLASIGAISMLDPQETDMNKAVSQVAMNAIKLRRAILNGDTSEFSIDIVETRANEGSGVFKPTVRLKAGERTLAYLQINQDTLASENPDATLVNAVGEGGLVKYFNKVMKSEQAVNNHTDRIATETLQRNPDAFLESPFGENFRGGEIKYGYFARKDNEGNLTVMYGPRIKMLGDRAFKDVSYSDTYNPRFIAKLDLNKKPPATDNYIPMPLAGNEMEDTQKWIDGIVEQAQIAQYYRSTQTPENLVQRDVQRPGFNMSESPTEEGASLRRELASRNFTARMNETSNEIERTIGDLLNIRERMVERNSKFFNVVENPSEEGAATRLEIKTQQSLAQSRQTSNEIERLVMERIQPLMGQPSEVDLSETTFEIDGKKLSINTEFDLWKSLWRDFPPLFIQSEQENKVKLQPNPKFFNLWQSLWRDFPPLFVEQD